MEKHEAVFYEADLRPQLQKGKKIWPYHETMKRLLENDPTVRLDHITEVVDSLKQRVTF